jgi:hypothetical protein
MRGHLLVVSSGTKQLDQLLSLLPSDRFKQQLNDGLNPGLRVWITSRLVH